MRLKCGYLLFFYFFIVNVCFKYIIFKNKVIKCVLKFSLLYIGLIFFCDDYIYLD